MDVSVGITAYNEGWNIRNLMESLLNQKLNKVKIKEVIIVSSGSTDNTDEIVGKYSKKYKKIKLIVQKCREGKYSAINKFLKAAKSDILILESADTIPEEHAIENLCIPFKDSRIGIVASRPVPKSQNNGFMGFLIGTQWDMHHKMSLKKPKFGEMISFRKFFGRIGRTAVDEEYIAMLIKESGYKPFYADNAIVYNFGPESIKDFLLQKRRINCGHLELKKRYGYKASSMDLCLKFKVFLKKFQNIKYMAKNFHYMVFAFLLDNIGRVLGLWDYCIKRNHDVWRVVG